MGGSKGGSSAPFSLAPGGGGGGSGRGRGKLGPGQMYKSDWTRMKAVEGGGRPGTSAGPPQQRGYSGDGRSSSMQGGEEPRATGQGRDFSNQKAALAKNAAKWASIISAVSGPGFFAPGAAAGGAYGYWDEMKRQKGEQSAPTNVRNISGTSKRTGVNITPSLLSDNDDDDDQTSGWGTDF